MLNVAVYCRISTDSNNRINSLHNQQEYFKKYVSEHSEWVLTKIYVEERISGICTKKRAKFNEMIGECMSGKIDLILTKDVSSFARNIAAAIRYTRILKKHGVAVLFIKDNIDTRDEDGELRLSATQGKPRRTSQGVSGGKQRSMKHGVTVENSKLFGYEKENGKLVLNENEAKIVKEIFNKYVFENKCVRKISNELFDEGIAAPKSERWSASMLLKLLQNEKYVGDLAQRKTRTFDFLSHFLKKRNKNIVYIKNHHDAIIDRNLWNMAQKKIEHKQYLKNNYSYWCSEIISCGVCGSRFVPKQSADYMCWGCRKRLEYGRTSCKNNMVNMKTVTNCAKYALKLLDIDQEEIKHQAEEEVKSVRGENRILSEESSKEVFSIIKNTESLIFSESVFKEIFGNIKVFENRFCFKLRYCEKWIEFKYKIHRYKESYKTEIYEYNITENEPAV